MADFDPPFGNGGERRAPTTDEQSLGFACGPADQQLFNWLFWSTQAEIKAVLLDAGITPSNDDMTQLLQAIKHLIDAAVAAAGSPSADYLLMTQARTRLPIFPEVQTADGRMGIVSVGTGVVRVPANVVFLHRGIYPVTTVQTDLSTDPSKIYHLRWSPTGGFVLRDTTNATYNPSTLAEDNPAFDSKYDDMLVARVISNSSNVPTVTDLANKSDLAIECVITGANRAGIGGEMFRFDTKKTLNWARKPTTFSFTRIQDINNSGRGDADFEVPYLRSSTVDNASLGVSRYIFDQVVSTDYTETLRMHFSGRA